MTSLIKTTFGEYIRLLRNENELTLTQLAAKLNLDSANLSKIENGKRDFYEKRLPKLAKIFKLNHTELRNEYFTDQIGKYIYETNCTKQLLQVAEQKGKERAEYGSQLLLSISKDLKLKYQNWLREKTYVYYKMYNSMGQLIKSSLPELYNSEITIAIPTDDLKEGFYFMQVYLNNRYKSVKWIKL